MDERQSVFEKTMMQLAESIKRIEDVVLPASSKQIGDSKSPKELLEVTSLTSAGTDGGQSSVMGNFGAGVSVSTPARFSCSKGVTIFSQPFPVNQPYTLHFMTASTPSTPLNSFAMSYQPPISSYFAIAKKESSIVPFNDLEYVMENETEMLSCIVDRPTFKLVDMEMGVQVKKENFENNGDILFDKCPQRDKVGIGHQRSKKAGIIIMELLVVINLSMVSIEILNDEGQFNENLKYFYEILKVVDGVTSASCKYEMAKSLIEDENFSWAVIFKESTLLSFEVSHTTLELHQYFVTSSFTEGFNALGLQSINESLVVLALLFPIDTSIPVVFIKGLTLYDEWKLILQSNRNVADIRRINFEELMVSTRSRFQIVTNYFQKMRKRKLVHAVDQYIKWHYFYLDIYTCPLHERGQVTVHGDYSLDLFVHSIFSNVENEWCNYKRRLKETAEKEMLETVQLVKVLLLMVFLVKMYGNFKTMDKSSNGHIDIFLREHVGLEMLGVSIDPYANNLTDVMRKRHASETCRSLLFYFEACESKSMHKSILSEGSSKKIEVHNFLANALHMDMLYKCGCINKIFVMFIGTMRQDVSTWNAKIAGLGTNGYLEGAVWIFIAITIDAIRSQETFLVSKLSTCSQGGLLSEGCRCLDLRVDNSDQSSTLEGNEVKSIHWSTRSSFFGYEISSADKKLFDNGNKNKAAPAIAIFSAQYDFVKHEFWKYKLKKYLFSAVDFHELYSFSISISEP